MAAEAPRREIVFVDNQVKDYQQLVAQVRPGTEVIVLDKTRDGLQQIADARAAAASTRSTSSATAPKAACAWARWS